VDEAHHAESAVRQATAVNLHPGHLEELLGPVLRIPDKDTKSTLRHLRVEAEDLLTEYEELGAALLDFVRGHTDTATLRLTPPVRRSRAWGTIEKKAEQWRGRSQFIIGLIEGTSAFQGGADAAAGLHDFSTNVGRFIAGSAERIQWLDLSLERDRVYLHDVALSIVPDLQQLYDRVHGVVFTSATLTTSGNFDYIKELLGITSAVEVMLPTSFPLQDTMLIYIVEDAPDPRTPHFDEYIAGHLASLSLLLGGRTLGLFTSYRSVSAVYQGLVRPLNKAQIKLYAQGHSGGKTNMLKRFRETPRSVLLGTDSFWEGIDVPGDTLSCVVIPKLPFTPPHDPVVEAMAEDQAVDSFSSLGLPRMILKLRQGMGRLIRRNEDRGVIVMFDSRLHRASYGDAVLKSLPAGRIKMGSADDLLQTVRSWFGEDRISTWKSE
jgi:Rad3-related DNA helicase